MNDRIVFGLIGAGGISRSQHLPNLSRASHIALKTVCDLNADLVQDAQKRYDIPHGTQQHKTLLADPEIQAVLIATRAESHVPLAIEALRAGKHVYVEKPLAETADECRRLTAAQKESGKQLAVAFNRRMAPAYQEARRIIDGHGGARNIHYRISDAYYIWGKAFGASPGTRIVHEVCHVFDLLRYLVGSEVKSIFCAASRDDDDSLLLQFANGAVATIMSSGYVTYDMPKETLEVVVDLGALRVEDCVELRTFGLDDCLQVYRFAGHPHPDRDITHVELFAKCGAEAMRQLRRVYYEKTQRLETLRSSGEHPQERKRLQEELDHHAPHINYMMDKGWLHAVDHFAQCLLDGRPCRLATAQDGLRAAQITQAALTSRREGRVVMLEP
ncbi:MAG: Gfo/Idh/MocA family oxidoreductase [Phycisphaerales bacterium]|jgi:predicted dehydrogenase|nr:Gfo/Idh/MocA family oxidoreductase [Phycisphaerales bacterium]